MSMSLSKVPESIPLNMMVTRKSDDDNETAERYRPYRRGIDP